MTSSGSATSAGRTSSCRRRAHEDFVTELIAEAQARRRRRSPTRTPRVLTRLVFGTMILTYNWFRAGRDDPDAGRRLVRGVRDPGRDRRRRLTCPSCCAERALRWGRSVHASRSSSAPCCTCSTRRRASARTRRGSSSTARSGSRSARRRPRRTRSRTRSSRTSAGRATSGSSCATRSSSCPSFYGAQAAGGVAVPLNADSRGLLLQRVIERADVRAIIARGDQLAVLRGARRARRGGADRRHVAGGRAALERARRARGRVPRVDLRPLLGARARAARQLRDRADPVHVGHDRQLEGRRLPAPLPVPVLGGRLGRAGAHERRRADDAAAAVPRRGAAHHLQLGAARRLHGAPEEPLLGALLLAGDRRRRRDVRDHPRDVGGDPAAHGRRGARAPPARAVLRAVPARRRGVRGSASA